MSSTNRTGFGPGAGLGVVTVVCGAIIAISPTWTWFRGTALRRELGPASGCTPIAMSSGSMALR